MTEPTLQEKLRANKTRSISQADVTAKREKQQKIQQQQKLQKQKEENDVAYQKHQKLNLQLCSCVNKCLTPVLPVRQMKLSILSKEEL